MAYLLTDMSQLRYTTMVPIACGIIFIRNIDSVINSVINVKIKKILFGVIAILSLMSFTGKIREISAYMIQIPDTDEQILIDFLKEQNLENGYAAFFDASKLTVLSGNDIKIRHIIKSDNGMEMHRWFTKKEWYSEEAEFVIVDNSKYGVNENESFGVTEDNVKGAFGEPSERFEVNKYIILVYNRNLSSQLKFDTR